MKKNIFYTAVLAFLMIILPCKADVIDAPLFNTENSYITISGNIEGSSLYDRVTITVVNPGVNEEELTVYTKEEIKKYYAGFTQTYVDSKGHYEAKIELKGKSGIYKIRVSSTALENPATYDYFYADMNDKKELSSKIVETKDSKDLQLLLDLENPESLNLKVLGIDYNLITDLDKNNLSDIIIGLNKENNPDSYDIDKVTGNILKAVKIEKLNESKADDLDLYIKEFNISDKHIALYNDRLSEKAKNDILKNISGKKLINSGEVKNIIEENILTSNINNTESWKDYIYLIENFGEEINLTDDTLHKYKAVKNKGKITENLKNNYSSLSDFTNDITNEISKIYKDEKKSDNKGGSGGSSGGGGGGHYVTPEVIAPPVIKPEIKKEFSDVSEDHFAYDAINKLYEKGVINGVSENEFAPEKYVKREEFVKMVVSAFNIVDKGEIDFVDVPESSWAYPFIKRAYGKGIIKGVSEDVFGMGNNLKRADASLIIFNILDKEPLTSELFKDDTDIPQYAKEAVYTLKEMNILKGNGEGLFEPQRALTRAECAYIIYKVTEGV